MSEPKKEQSGSMWELVQSNLWQLLELQRGQQRTLERFLDLQLEMLRAASGGAVTAEELSATEALAAAAPAARPAPAVTPIHVTALMARRKAAAGQVSPAPQVVGLRPQAEPQAGPPAAAPPREAAPREEWRAKAPHDVAAPDASQPTDDSVETFQDHLLAAVSKRTGYPKEMLGLDRNMEADLGIDSIKKIEVFSELREHHAVLRVEDEERTLEELSSLRTLGSIVDWYRRNLEKKNHLTPQQRSRSFT